MTGLWFINLLAIFIGCWNCFWMKENHKYSTILHNSWKIRLYQWKLQYNYIVSENGHTAKNKLNTFLVNIIKINRIVNMEATEAFKGGGDYSNMVEGEVINLSKYGWSKGSWKVKISTYSNTKNGGRITLFCMVLGALVFLQTWFSMSFIWYF